MNRTASTVDFRRGTQDRRPPEEIAKQRIDFSAWVINATGATPELRISAGMVQLAHEVILGGQSYNIVPTEVAETDLTIPMATPGTCYAYLEMKLQADPLAAQSHTWKMTAINPSGVNMPATVGVFWRKVYFQITVPDYSSTDRNAPSVARYRQMAAFPVSLGITAPMLVGDVLACREFDEDGALIALGSETGTSWSDIDTGHSLWWYPTPLVDLLP